ncbi:Sec-independent protein translocase protein TatC [Roseobacter cerasinus]|uniref:Sec-independent protein translocase protein TatC n=1 Tax=Roseobacter cerasinus TaxID=2602289 RepID=A0A640VL94_9RHOB|nr:twin-arginine translocase subunit TatC [Roseobacter cerasinus]GFE48527.1 Sec-independent protein translocase protein TatC [Roseobacter cerasinus]
MSSSDDIDDSAAPLIEHLAELRTRLIRSVIAFIVGIVLAFTVAEPILQFLLGPIEETLRELGDPSPTMQYTSPQEYLFTLFRISMVFGFALAFPVIGVQLWRFVAPGLYKTEKNAFLPFLIASPVMFLLGASFAHFVVTPLAMAFFLGFADVPSVIADLMSSFTNAGDVPVVAGAVDEGIRITFFGKVNESLDITLKFIMAFGLCFQLPVLLTLMGKAGLVSAEGLGNVRKYAVVAILVLAALVTPPDVITQGILFTVVYGLYEVSIFLVKRVEKTREAKLRAEGAWFEDDEEADDLAEDDLK